MNVSSISSTHTQKPPSFWAYPTHRHSLKGFKHKK